jgi:hypothetical protein
MNNPTFKNGDRVVDTMTGRAGVFKYQSSVDPGASIIDFGEKIGEPIATYDLVPEGEQGCTPTV